MKTKNYSNALRSDGVYVFTSMIIFAGIFLLYTDASNRVISFTDGEENIQNTQVSVVGAAIDTGIIPQPKEVEIETTTTPLVVKNDTSETPVVTPEIVVEVIEEVETEEVPFTEETNVPEETLEISAEVVQASPVSLPYLRSIFGAESGWVLGYGGISFVNDDLVIGGETDTASLALLSNSNSLTDYEVHTTLDWNRGASFSLVTRFADYDNYVTCQFLQSASQVSIISIVEGERISEASSPGLPVKTFEGWKGLQLGMSVSGNTVSCLKNGKVVLASDVSEIPAAGGVGLALWGKFPGDALAHIKEVRIR